MDIFLKKPIENSSSSTAASPFNFIARALILFYQATFSFFLGGNCRYYPSCSQYAHEAFVKHKPLYAFYLVVRRLLSCHPFSKKAFFDPVPIHTRGNKHEYQ